MNGKTLVKLLLIILTLPATAILEVVAPELVLDEARRIAREIAAKSPMAVRLAKECILKAQDTSLIVEPHGGDVFLLQTNSHIMLQAKKVVRWFVNGEPQGSGSSLSFVPSTPGEHTIQAIAEDHQEETITIDIVE